MQQIANKEQSVWYASEYKYTRPISIIISSLPPFVLQRHSIHHHHCISLLGSLLISFSPRCCALSLFAAHN